MLYKCKIRVEDWKWRKARILTAWTVTIMNNVCYALYTKESGAFRRLLGFEERPLVNGISNLVRGPREDPHSFHHLRL